MTVWKAARYDVFFFETGMTIDADGSPHAYHPDNTGIDDNAHGKDEKGKWVGIVLANRKPYIQNATDPAPGYYVSTTSLYDKTRRRTDPQRYVDSERIPYLALPRQVMHPDGDCRRDAKACLGDIAIVRNTETACIPCNPCRTRRLHPASEKARSPSPMPSEWTPMRESAEPKHESNTYLSRNR